MESAERELVDLRKKIDRLKTRKASLEGEQKSIMSRLKKDYNLDSIEAASKLLQTFKEKVEKNKKRKELLTRKVENHLLEMEADDDAA